MSQIARLVTFVHSVDSNLSQLSFSARHDALLADGRRVVLLDDRGWSQSSPRFFTDHEVPAREEASSVWQGITRKHIEEVARSVAGPDYGYGDFTEAELDESHRAYLSDVLERQGVHVDANDLAAIPHDVELSDRLLIRIGEQPN